MIETPDRDPPEGQLEPHMTGTITGDVSTSHGFSGQFTATFQTNQKSDPWFVGESGIATT